MVMQKNGLMQKKWGNAKNGVIQKKWGNAKNGLIQKNEVMQINVNAKKIVMQKMG